MRLARTPPEPAPITKRSKSNSDMLAVRSGTQGGQHTLFVRPLSQGGTAPYAEQSDRYKIPSPRYGYKSGCQGWPDQVLPRFTGSCGSTIETAVSPSCCCSVSSPCTGSM